MAGKTRKKRSIFKRKFTKLMQKKLVMLFVGIILAFAVLVGRITYINASNGERYSKLVLDQQQYGSRTIPFKRGDIVDRNGTKLATSTRVYNVILDVRVMLSDEKYVEPTIQVLEECFGLDGENIRTLAKEDPSSRYAVLVKGINYDKAKEFEQIDKDDENYPNVNGIWLEEDYIRTYPYNSTACDVIGFTVDGNVGSNGIEGYFNSVLNGTDGKEYGYQDKTAAYERTVKEPENGSTVVSTIDLEVQNIVEKHILAFNEAHRNNAWTGEGSKNTAVIVMNPQNGEILAEASFPNYDLNNPRDLSAYYTEEELSAMNDEQRLETLYALWNNFCVSETFEPGSTIKPFTVAAGLELGTLTGDESYDCYGFLQVEEWKIDCNNKTGHGTQTLKRAVENSCNVALMEIGQQMGVEDFVKYQKVFGFGEFCGIDLPGEAGGLLYTVENMDPVSLSTNAFGQNFTVTMTQLAASFCSLVNGGDYYKPHVVKQIQDENGNVTENKTPVLIKKTISKETSDIVKDYMLGVVEEGTGGTAKVEGYDVGGKTGTAEKLPRGNEKYVLSFIGYAPQENPQIVVYVAIDEVNSSFPSDGRLAPGLASDIMKEIFPYLGISKSIQTSDE
ncbi:penicillin-binding protein 2 [Lachnospiraceae bacterium 42-17]|nr:penicillin-binding protein 2 [Dorea sp.]